MPKPPFRFDPRHPRPKKKKAQSEKEKKKMDGGVSRLKTLALRGIADALLYQSTTSPVGVERTTNELLVTKIYIKYTTAVHHETCKHIGYEEPPTRPLPIALAGPTEK
jgi:hypothetical protein